MYEKYGGNLPRVFSPLNPALQQYPCRKFRNHNSDLTTLIPWDTLPNLTLLKSADFHDPQAIRILTKTTDFAVLTNRPVNSDVRMLVSGWRNSPSFYETTEA